MKKNILLSIFFTLFISFGLLSNKTLAYIDFYDESKCLMHDMIDDQLDLDWYKVYKGDVYLASCKMKGMDPNTIENLIIDGKRKVSYAQDKNNVYYLSRVLTGLEPGKFKIKTIGRYGVILYDDDTIYFDGNDISDVHPDIETLETIEGYYRDKDFLYKQTYTGTTESNVENYDFTKLKDADPDNFTDGYKITDNAVYWYGKKIEEADAESFKVRFEWSNEIATDKNNVYNKGEVMQGKDVSSFGIFDIKRNGKPTLEVKMDKYKANKIKNKYPKESDNINASLKSSLLKYREKYPHYIPKPAQDPENPDKLYNLKRYLDYYILDYKYLNPPIYYTIISIPFILSMIIVGVFVWKRRKRKKKGGKKK